jgi:hypothetical protein
MKIIIAIAIGPNQPVVVAIYPELMNAIGMVPDRLSL